MIFGCAASLTVFATLLVAARKFATTVVDVTTKGAVPVATFEINCGAVTLALANTCAVPILPMLALPVTLNAPAVVRLPPLTLPVALTRPPVVKLPPETLPVAVINPAVPRLPTLALPVAFNVPATFTPVPVTSNTFALPATVMAILPPLLAITMFDVPLLIPLLATVAHVNTPLPLVCKN